MLHFRMKSYLPAIKTSLPSYNRLHMQHDFNSGTKMLNPGAIVVFLKMGDKFTSPKFRTVLKISR